MPISQFPQPCWVVDPPGGPGGEDHEHWLSEAAAREAVAEGYPAEDYAPGEVTAVQNPDPCWVVACDGKCGAKLEDSEWEWTLHLDGRTEAEQYAAEAGWIVTRNGEVFCEDDAPDCSTADLVVPGPIPGQLTLDGGEVSGATP